MSHRERRIDGAHLSRLMDAKAPLATRLVACYHAADTFFYRQTALRRLREAADDPACPKAVQESATRVIAYTEARH